MSDSFETHKSHHGQEKCPKCGATDISFNINTGKLRCNFCRYEFEPEISGTNIDQISNLNEEIISAGSKNIQTDTNDLITIKCQSCGSEVVIDSKNAYQARCHWCRNTLSLKDQIPNGSVPDKVLPFKVTKEQAQKLIKQFVNKRKFFALKQFKKEFVTDNIMGVFFPYMLVDINAKANFSGRGEHTIRTYLVQRGKHQVTRHDIEVYGVGREFDIVIDNLSVESSANRLNKYSHTETNNVINAIMPFDTENCVDWNANYLQDFTSEKRDTNVDQLSDMVNTQAKNLAKFQINKTLEYYDRGVFWQQQDFSIKGRQWEAAYLPVWLYSYKQPNQNLIHYVAVNARTQEVMGSVPLNHGRLLFWTILLEIFGGFAGNWLYHIIDSALAYLTLAGGIVFYIGVYLYYRNTTARHTYEAETNFEIQNLVSTDNHIEDVTGVSSSSTDYANNRTLDNEPIYEQFINEVKDKFTNENHDNIFKL